MVSSRDVGHHRGRVGLHPTPCTEQPFNRDLRIPAVCLSVFCCRSLRKLFLPDSLRRSGFPWCALVLAALHRKVILACSRRFCCQGTLVFNLRIGESPFRKVLSKSLQIFCCLTNRNPQGQFHIQFFEIFKISSTHEAGALWLRDEFSSSQPSETDGSV